MTPFPDQDIIHNDMARSAYQALIDMSEAYEQIHIVPEHIHVYLDDIFIYLCSIKEHEKHLGIVFQWLRDHHLFLSQSKVDLYSKRLECLGHIIDD